MNPSQRSSRTDERDFTATRHSAAASTTDERHQAIRQILDKINKRRRPMTAMLNLAEQCRPATTVQECDNEDTLNLLEKLREELLRCYTENALFDAMEQRLRQRGASFTSQRTLPSMSYPATNPTHSFDAEISSLNRQAPSLFRKILFVLHDLILNDCRYPSANPTPKRPPYFMQHILIDIGTLLVQLQNDLVSLCSLGNAFLPAFESFHQGPLLGKLLSIFVDSLLPKMMECQIGSIRPNDYNTAPEETRESDEAQNKPSHKHKQSMTPTINIHGPDSDEVDVKRNPISQLSPLTIDTGLSSNYGHPHQTTSLRSAIADTTKRKSRALFTPLLAFMIQFLDPYLSMNDTRTNAMISTSLPDQQYSIFSFHRALQYIIRVHPDLHIDLLDIIARSTPDIKYRGCQILFQYYSISAGHMVVTDQLPKIGYRDENYALDDFQTQFLEERQRQQQQQQQHTELNGFDTMANVSAIGFQPLAQNQRYLLDPYTEQNINSRDATEECPSEEHHVWFPHIFAEYSKYQADELTIQVHRLSAGVQSLNAMIHDDMNGAYCRECYKIIKGYGLRCYQCKCSLHYGCHVKDDLGIMLYVKEGGIQKVVTPQFSRIAPQPRCTSVGKVEQSITPEYYPARVDIFGHQFSLVNLFTLVMCVSCRLPLWGIAMQGYQCSICNRFVHAKCLASAACNTDHKNGGLSTMKTCQPYQPLIENDTKIPQHKLCSELKDFYEGAIIESEDDLTGRSFEEVGTILNILTLQENIIENGISSGSILVTHDSDDPPLSPSTLTVESESTIQQETALHPCICLHSAIEKCKAHIASGNCKASSFLGDFYRARYHSVEECVLSKEEYLSHVAAMMNSLASSESDGQVPFTKLYPQEHSPGNTRDFLDVEPKATSRWNFNNTKPKPDGPHVIMDTKVMLSWLEENLQIRNPKVCQILLQHMVNLGLFEPQNGSPLLYSTDTKSVDVTSQTCIFPIPYALTYSPSVESLVAAIEACLTDIDITINECGLLLLVRRCWPDPFMSQYVTEQLIRAILCWVFQEDDKLSILHAEYTTSNTLLPNVKLSRWQQAAQAALAQKNKSAHLLQERNRQSMAAGISSGAGNFYVATRSALRDRYIIRWMATMHDIDKELYATMLFDGIEKIIDGKQETHVFSVGLGEYDRKKMTIQKYEEFIGCILKLKTVGLTFSSFESVLQQWLDKAFADFQREGLLQEREPLEIRNLAKLCSSKITLPKFAGSPNTTAESIHAMDVITNMFRARDPESVRRGIHWLTLVIHAGTGVPSNLFAKMARLLVEARAPINVLGDFVKLLWFQAVNILNVVTSRAVVVDIIGYLNEIALETLSIKNQVENLSHDRLANAQTFIKYSAALACFAYSCPLQMIVELDIVPFSGERLTRINYNKHASAQAENAAPTHVDGSTPIIRCMLAFLKMDQLNVRADVLKMFHALVNLGGSISSKSDLISSCAPNLIAAIWEMLPPTNDHISDINLALLMKLIGPDPQCFHACVYKVFEDPNWEVRYQGLDNLYGLFTKMDVAFQTKWLSLLSYLGPVFSYFVACLWDKEEYVRSKAFALIRSFGALHLRSAFRCWEAHFMSCTDREKATLAKLMIMLNSMFPDWQVIQWELLLEALENCDQDGSDMHSVDILVQFTHTEALGNNASGNTAEGTDTDKLVEQNAKTLLLSLALQMLSNNLSIDSVQISRLKLILVRQMGFRDCQRYNTSGEWIVSFGNLAYDPSNQQETSVVIVFSRELKKVMDSFAPLPAETVASMTPDALERHKLELAENSSPGVHFIDVVLRLFNSGIDLTLLNHIMLKTWLETILIVVYKHNILEKELEQDIVNCMKQIIELITKDIGEENRLLILEILKCLLRRSEHLTAMVLSKQIMALGKLLTTLGTKMSEPVFMKAKDFLKSAFLRFAMAGLFVLMFKNQTVSDERNRDVDLFFVLRTVIDPEDVIPDEYTHGTMYLRDQPVRDVLDKLMKQQMERRSFSTVLQNLCRYVEVVHWSPYSDAILSDFATFLITLCKHTANWRRSDWDINPVITMSAILLKGHPYHLSILLPQIQVLLKHAILNCNLQPESVAKLLTAYWSISSVPGVPPRNGFVDIILSELKEGLTSRHKLHKDTVLVLLQLILWDNNPDYSHWFVAIENSLPGEVLNQGVRTRYFEGCLPDLVQSMTFFLKNPPIAQQFTKKEFKLYSAVSSLLVSACIDDEIQRSRILEFLKMEDSKQSLRFLSWFLLALLGQNSKKTSKTMMLLQDCVADILSKTLRSAVKGLASSRPDFSDDTTFETIALCFTVIKSCALIPAKFRDLSKADSANTGNTLAREGLWMTVWPALRALVERINPVDLFTPGHIGLSVWNALLSLIRFLFACRSNHDIAFGYEWTQFFDWLVEQLKVLSNSMNDMDQVPSILSVSEFISQIETVQKMFVLPPVEVPISDLIDQLLLNQWDLMRLQTKSTVLQNGSRDLLFTTNGL